MACNCLNGQYGYGKKASKTPLSLERIVYLNTTSSKPDASIKVETTKSFDYDVKIENDEPMLVWPMDDAFKETERKMTNRFLRAHDHKFLGMTEVEESSWNGNYQFICMGDAQLGMGDQKKEEEFSRCAVEFINKRKDSIKFVVICGDLTHNLEDIWSKGDVELGRRKRIQELAAFKGIYSKLYSRIPLVCVCGNHDVGNKPTEKTVKMYKEEFGDDYFSFWCGGVKYITLNSQILQGLPLSNHLSIAHEEWADNEFEMKNESEPVHSVVLCHIPPFCWDAEEKHTNFNWPKEKREKWLEKMFKGKVKKVYCSHYHRRAGGKYKDLEVVVTGALGTHIRTKNVPLELQGSRLDEINFKLSYEGFGGVEASEETSGLQVVTVSKDGLTEEWLNIKQMMKEIKTPMELS